MKLFVIGDADAVLGFSLVGMSGRVAHTAQEVREALQAVAQDPDVGAILVTEEAASWVREQMDALRIAKTGPIVVEIPGPGGPLPGRPALHDVIARATGVRL